ncbi:transcription antitermination factor NusB [Lutibacter sp. HS1-25]|uniref:transcription antitermination factor NusB n=1 Tax=Lutibacter sp. HS1-25 TaxID=2485000 RepID=UPI0010132FF4|nr:transcription antitermination factor NusB [Lutibacter sp. HS1-25]RXP52326.1 transcription antitermination factor NusB [Lutibacter sp. HS1-25]
MINRRHIRVKVMQSVYALQQSKSDNLIREEKFLYYSIDKMYDMYALLLRLLVEVRNLESNHIAISKKKFLATAEEKNPNTKFIDNTVFNILSESVSLNEYLETQHLTNWELDDEYVKEVWKLTKESEIYASYMESNTNNFQEDKEFVVAMFKTIVAPNDKIADYFEDKNITWVDDIPFVNTWIVKTLNSLKANGTLQLGRLYKDDDDKKFVVDLFRKVVLNQSEFEKEIEDKTPNWDKDRIAEIDLILIKMAIAEFLKFPSIPTSVSINEYIEISKDYSTDKSSYFINGVLDKILKEFSASKRLNKIGRGLI